MSGICILSHLNAARWEETGKRPNCDFHHHTSFHRAEEMVKNDEAHWAEGGHGAIVVFTCVKEYTWQGRKSAGYQVLQMVPIRPKARNYIAT